jgi:hypothetical protein
MGLLEELKKLNKHLDSGAYRAQFEYGSEDLRLEILETADLLFEVGDKVEEILTDLMVRQGFAQSFTPGAASRTKDPAE